MYLLLLTYLCETIVAKSFPTNSQLLQLKSLLSAWISKCCFIKSWLDEKSHSPWKNTCWKLDTLILIKITKSNSSTHKLTHTNSLKSLKRSKLFVPFPIMSWTVYTIYWPTSKYLPQYMTSLLFLKLDSFLTPPKQVSECNFNHFLFSERQDTY